MKRNLRYNGSDKMGEDIKIREEVNEKIKNKIESGKYPEEIKEFLKKILLLEFEHIDEARPRIMEEYIDYIKKYAGKTRSE